MIVAVVLCAALASAAPSSAAPSSAAPSSAAPSRNAVVYEQTLTATVGDDKEPVSQATSTMRCVGHRCLAKRGAFGVYPRVDVFGDVDSGALWLIDPDHQRKAVAERFRPFDRLWFVDSTLAPALVEVDPGKRARPPLADAATTYWRADSDDVTLEVWVRPFPFTSARALADQLELRTKGAGKDLARLPGVPIFVQHSVRRPPANVVTRWTLTALREEADVGGVVVPDHAVVAEDTLIFGATPAAAPAPKTTTTTTTTTTMGPSPWRAFGTGARGRDVFADDSGVWACDGDRCHHVGGAAVDDVAVPCGGYFSASAGGRYFAVDCYDDRVIVVGVKGGVRVVTADVSNVVVDDDGRLTWVRRKSADDDSLVAERETAGATLSWPLHYTIPDNGSNPDLGTGAVIAVTHALGGKDEAAFFVEGGKLVRRTIGGGGLINGDCLWISEMRGGYTRLTPLTSTTLPQALLRGAAPPDGADGLLDQTLPWGNRGYLAVYERRIDLLDRDLRPVRSLPKADGAVVVVAKDGGRVYAVDKDGVVAVADVSADVDRAAVCAGP